MKRCYNSTDATIRLLGGEVGGKELKRILVVDDSAVSRKLALFVLKNLGCEARGVPSAAEAFEALRNEVYDAIFMDLHMPEMNGCEASMFIRRSGAGEANRSLPIFAITGSDLPEERESCVSAGMTDFLAKPFSGEHAEALLRKHCGKTAHDGQ